MKLIRTVLHQKACYFIAFIAILCIAFIISCTTSKTTCFLKLNGLHTKWLDTIFTNLTMLGDGIFSLLIVAILMFIRKLRGLSVHIFITYLVSGVAAQLLKHLFMAPRPKEIISTHIYANFLNGISGSGWDSFPSGHTTSIFALTTIAAFYIAKKRWVLFLLATGITVGYSRIYLGHHFLQDVMAGAVLGTLTAVFIYSFVSFPGKYFKKRIPASTSHDDEAYSSSLAGNYHP